MDAVSVGDVEVPSIGLGTWRLSGEECERVVGTALELGYRHVDTAEMYGNEAAVGRAIAESPVDRDEVFLTTKVWRTNLEHDQVLRSANESLRKLGVDAVDLLLVHWPSHSVPVEETLGAFDRLAAEGKARHIGVSNFDLGQLVEARSLAEAPIVCDQVPYDPTRDQQSLQEYCAEEGLLMTAYSPLAKGRLASNTTLAEVGRAHGKTAAQVCLRWLIQQEQVAAIPKASSPEHLAANLDVFDFALTDDEMARVAAL